MNISEISEKITPILKKYGVEYAGIFGSVARGEAREDSDVDILVKNSKPIGLLKFFKLGHEIENVLGKKVDLVTEKSLDQYVKSYVLADLKPLYEVK